MLSHAASGDSPRMMALKWGFSRKNNSQQNELKCGQVLADGVGCQILSGVNKCVYSLDFLYGIAASK